MCYLNEALGDCKTTSETQKQLQLAKKTKVQYEELWKISRTERAMIHEQNAMIEGLQAQLEKQDARVQTLTERCHKCSLEGRKYKRKLESVANMIRNKDCKLEIMEKEKVGILLMQQQQASEADRLKREFEKGTRALEERNKKLEKSLEISIRKNKKLVQEVDDLKWEKLSTEAQVEEVNDFGSSIFDVPKDFMNAIVTWMEEHPKEVTRKGA